MAAARKELADRVRDVERITGEADQKQKVIAERDASIVCLREELAQLGANSSEELQTLKNRVVALETERGALVADLDLAGKETTRLLEEFDQLDTLWESKFDSVQETANPASGTTAEKAPDPEPEAPHGPGKSILSNLPGGKALTGVVDKALNPKLPEPFDGAHNGLGSDAALSAAKDSDNASLADRFRALQNRFI